MGVPGGVAGKGADAADAKGVAAAAAAAAAAVESVLVSVMGVIGPEVVIELAWMDPTAALYAASSAELSHLKEEVVVSRRSAGPPGPGGISEGSSSLKDGFFGGDSLSCSVDDPADAGLGAVGAGAGAGVGVFAAAGGTMSLKEDVTGVTWRVCGEKQGRGASSTQAGVSGGDVLVGGGRGQGRAATGDARWK